MSDDDEVIDLKDWYGPKDAAERLSANSGKPIATGYLRTLDRYGKVRSYQISERVRLYRKEDIDNYVVEERGVKSARAKRTKALKKKNNPKKGLSENIA